MTEEDIRNWGQRFGPVRLRRRFVGHVGRQARLTSARIALLRENADENEEFPEARGEGQLPTIGCLDGDPEVETLTEMWATGF